ncbi:MAG TPA: FoF1 ATP synthase subunit a [bacterium]|nr:FoF1 ATP synthase subunit a [bacterium]
MFFRLISEQPSIQPEVIFRPFGWPISVACLLSWLIILILIALVISVRQLKLRPGKKQVSLEMFYGLILGLITQLTGSTAKAKKILPLFGSLFIFILLSNYIGYIPGLGSLTWNGIAIFRTPTNDFNMTIVLALFVILYIQLASIKQIGFFPHIGKYVQIKGVWQGFRKGLMAGFISLIDFAVGLMDIISEFARVISLSLRLFGNIFAGEVLTAIIISAFAWLLPSTWMAMGLLSGLVQAVVFTSLSSVYYALAVEEPAAN